MDITLNNGVTMPALGLGVFQSPPEQTTATVQSAVSAGCRHIDTAAAYGNEREVGEGIRRSGLDRADVFLETKVWVSDYGYEQTLHAWEKAVGKLGVDSLDLLILHQPAPDETDVVPAVNQVELHPYFSQPEVRAANAAHGIRTQAWSPIGGITFYPGWGEDRRSVMQEPVLAEIGQQHGVRSGPDPDVPRKEIFAVPVPEA